MGLSDDLELIKCPKKQYQFISQEYNLTGQVIFL